MASSSDAIVIGTYLLKIDNDGGNVAALRKQSFEICPEYGQRALMLQSAVENCNSFYQKWNIAFW